MLVADMRAINKALLNLRRHRITPPPSLSFPSLSSLHDGPDPGISAWSGSVVSGNGSGVPSNRAVYTVYDALSGRLVTKRGAKPVDDEDRGGTEEREGGDGPIEGFVGDLNGETEDREDESDRGENFVRGIGNKKIGKGKRKVHWVCSSCGHSDGQWWGSCRNCHQIGTVKKFIEGENDIAGGGKINGFEVSENAVKSWLPRQAVSVPLKLTDVNRGVNQMTWRIPLCGLFGSEVARVLGGGLVPGSLVLVGGDPGVGKSTLLLQMAAMIAEGVDNEKPAPVIYVSGEESVEQIGNRADRLNIGTEELYLYSSTDIEDIMEKIQKLSPRVLIIDSIQTVHLRGVTGSPGGIFQVKECTFALLRFAKKTNIPVLLIGHVTKSGDIAGPRVLEHIVDVVLYMEGEKHSSHRLLRPIKNRFGSTDELGVFEMLPTGLEAVTNPSEIFLTEQYTDSEILAGLAVAVVMDGSRSFLIEIQALCAPGSSRQVNGVQANRADMIISTKRTSTNTHIIKWIVTWHRKDANTEGILVVGAAGRPILQLEMIMVLKKQAGLKLQDNGIFLNVVSGVTVSETAGDLAVAAAICSSFFEFPIPSGVAFIGEIGLGGEIRAVPRMEKRLHTVAKLGYHKCIVPKSVEKSLAAIDIEGTNLVACRNLKEMISLVFTPH